MGENLEPIAVKVERAAELVGISRATMFLLVMASDVPSFKVGRRRVIPLDGLRAWAARRTTDLTTGDAA